MFNACLRKDPEISDEIRSVSTMWFDVLPSWCPKDNFKDTEPCVQAPVFGKASACLQRENLL